MVLASSRSNASIARTLPPVLLELSFLARRRLKQNKTQDQRGPGSVDYHCSTTQRPIPGADARRMPKTCSYLRKP